MLLVSLRAEQGRVMYLHSLFTACVAVHQSFQNEIAQMLGDREGVMAITTHTADHIKRFL